MNLQMNGMIHLRIHQMKLRIMISSFEHPRNQNIFKNNFSDDVVEMFLEHHELGITEHAEVLFNKLYGIIIHII